MEPEDDESIGPGAKLLRRLHPDFIHDGVPEGSAFKPDSSPGAIGTSVTLWESEQDQLNVLAGWEHFGLVVVNMSECRAIGLGIVRTPQPGNPNHCELFGPKSPKKRRVLSKASRWVKYPDDYPAELRGPVEGLED